jgi:SNF family Na+-dependent transporter
MKFAKSFVAVAALSMVAAPAMAASNPAASLSVSKSVRASSASGKKNELAGGGIIVAVLAAAAVVAGIVIIADDNSSSN